MKKFKKVFAVLLTLAMVLGMSMTSFAASTDKGSITINGLVAGTQINVYKFISLNTANSQWDIAEWAESYVKEEKGQYTITDAAALAKAVTGTPTFTETIADNTTTYTKSEVEIGAYLILATGTGVTYTPMVADVAAYGENGLITAKQVTITAKTSGYTVGKEADDNFVARGEEVTFTINTIFPTFEDYNAEGNSYKIVDKPTGLDITSVESVSIGGDPVSNITGEMNDENEYVIDLSSQINANNAGKPVVVVYKATVTADDGYSNSANAYRNNTELGETDTVVNGYTGSITVRKVETGTTNPLNGAEFTVSKVVDGAPGTPLYFVSTGTGEYKLAASTEEGASQTVVATNGTVKVKGLDEGTYRFTETKAPEGYSVAQGVMNDVTITEDDEKNVDLSGTGLDYPNTKLSSLPGTGGIGTTIFTIGGCAIMIVAAALFFASRRKAAK